jgi:hypothetical protein
LTDLEIRVSCHSNTIDLKAAVCQQPELAELAYKTKQLESLTSDHALEDEVSLLKIEHALLRDQNELLRSLLDGWAIRATAISDVVAQRGFGEGIPCRNILGPVPPSPRPDQPILNVQEVALGQPILEWVDYKMRSYHSDPCHRGRGDGALEHQLWEDLPWELKWWMLEPRPEPMGFLRNWYHALMSEGLPSELWKSLETVRQNARADQGDQCCKTCKPNNHRVTHRPRGSLLKRTLEKLRIRRR